MPTWKIKHELNDPVEASELGLEDLLLTLQNQDVDRLRMNDAGGDIDAADQFDYGDAIILYKDATVWFRGTIIVSPRFGSSSSETHRYEVVNAWYDLRPTFQQVWSTGAAATDTKTHVVLGKDESDNDLELGEVLKQILDYAISLGAGLSYVQTELDALSDMMPFDDRTDITCAEAIRAVLRWVPDCQTSFDYSSATPVLHFTRRASASTVSYNCTDGSIVGDGFEIKARNDLLKDGVVLNYEKQNSASEWNAVDRDIYPLAHVTGLDTFQMTIVLGQFGSLTTAPVGLAETIYESVSVLHYEGRLPLAEDECTAGPAPGKVLNLTGGLAAWATMNAVIQVVEFNIDAADTTITFGPPAHLGVRDYISLLYGNRLRNAGLGSGPGDSGYDTMPSGDTGEMMVKTTVGWEALNNPSQDAFVIYDDGSGAINHMLNVTGSPAMIVIQDDGTIELKTLGSVAQLIYHDGSGGLATYNLPNGGTEALFVFDGAGGISKKDANGASDYVLNGNLNWVRLDPYAFY